MSSGKYASLQQLRPLEGDISTDILNREDQQFKYREEERLKAEQKAKDKAAKNAELKDAMSMYTALKIPITGSTSIDEVFSKTITVAAERQNELLNIVANKDKYSQMEIIKAGAELKQIAMLPDNLLAMTNAITAEKANYDDMVKNGKWLKNEDYEKRFSGDYKNISVVLKDGMPVSIFRKNYSDKNDDGVIGDDEFDSETLESLSDASQRPTFLPNINRETMIELHSKRLVPEDNTTVTNGGFGSNQTIQIGEGIVDKTTKALFYNENGAPTPTMLSFLKQQGLEATEQNMKSVYDNYAFDLNNSIKKTTKQTLNKGAQISAGHLKIAQDKANKENAQTSTISLNTNEKKQPVKVTKDIGSIKKDAFEFSVNTSNEKNKLIGEDYTKVTNWYLNPDNSVGYSYVIAKYDKEKEGWVDTKKTSSAKNLTDDGLAAVNSGFNSVAELSAFLQAERDAKLGKTQSSGGGLTDTEFEEFLKENKLK